MGDLGASSTGAEDMIPELEVVVASDSVAESAGSSDSP